MKFGWKGLTWGTSSLRSILLSGNHAIIQTSSVGDDIGVLSVTGTSGYSFTITADPDSQFQMNADGVTLEVGAALVIGSHSVTVQGTKGGAPTLNATFSISVVGIVLYPSVGNLTLSPTAPTVTVGAPPDYTPSLDFSDPRNSMYIGQVV